MSQAIVLTKQGVTVQKELVTEGVPLPAVRFAIESDRSVPMAVRMAERLPDSVSVRDIGFHEEYDRECWRTDGGQRLAFERVIEPGERVITVYFIRDSIDDLSHFEQPPTIDQVQPVDEEDTMAAPIFRGSSAVESPIDDDLTLDADISGVDIGPHAGDLTLGEPHANGDEPDDGFIEASPDEPLELNEPPDDTPVRSAEIDEDTKPEASPDEPLKLNEPTDDESVEPTADVDGAIDADSHADSTPDLDAGLAETVPEPIDDTLEDRIEAAVERALASQDAPDSLRDDLESVIDDRIAASRSERSSGDPSEPVLDRLLEELDETDTPDLIDDLRAALGVGTPNHLTARIKRVEGELNELAAYTDALKEFLDDRGSARAVLDRVENRIDAMGTDIQSVEDRLDEIAADRDEIDDIQTELETIHSALDTYGQTLETTRSRTDDRLDAIADDISTLADRHQTLVSAFQSAAADLSTDSNDDR